MNQRSLSKISIIIILSAFLLSCSKENLEEIQYGNLTGKMAFEQGCCTKIVIIDFDKKKATTIYPKRNTSLSGGSVSLSPNGEMLAYSAIDNSSGGYQVFSMFIDGGDYIQLTKADKVVRHFNWPTWNIDGTKIFYVETGSIIGGPVYSVLPNGDNNMMVADLIVHTRVCVSKNENYLLLGLKGFPVYPSGGIFIYDIQKHKLNQLVVADSTFYAHSPVYSPDEKKIAYVIGHGPDDQGTEPYYNKIMTINADGSEAKTVIKIPYSNTWNYTYVTWSPEGAKLAFNGPIYNSNEKTDHIYVINLDGTGLTRITSGKDGETGIYWIK
jgi:Tol biopolymer transport system component